MGRRKDDPRLQAAKGHPGRRKREVNAQIRGIEAAAGAAEREFDPLQPFQVPAMFRAAPAFYRRAIEVWNEQVGSLKVAGRRRPAYRAALARYCLWQMIYESAATDLRRDCPKGSFIIAWTPVNGSERRVPHPALKIMQDAEPILRNLEGEFGFTPRSDGDLVRVETFNRGQRQGNLFPDPLAQPGNQAGNGEGDGDPMDLMTSTDSAPPGALN